MTIENVIIKNNYIHASPLSDKGGVIALCVDELSDEGEDGDDRLLVTATNKRHVIVKNIVEPHQHTSSLWKHSNTSKSKFKIFFKSVKILTRNPILSIEIPVCFLRSTIMPYGLSKVADETLMNVDCGSSVINCNSRQFLKLYKVLSYLIAMLLLFFSVFIHFFSKIY